MTGPAAGEWRIHLPAPADWLNANKRRSHRAATSTRQAWRAAALVAARRAHLPRRPGLARAHILAILRFTDTRRRDAANFHPTVKVIVDALVSYGLLADDSTAYLDGPDLRIGTPMLPKPYGPVGQVDLTIRELAPIEVPR